MDLGFYSAGLTPSQFWSLKTLYMKEIFSTALSQETKTQLTELAILCQFRKKNVILFPHLMKVVVISRKY